jgi:hypothetical protein
VFVGVLVVCGVVMAGDCLGRCGWILLGVWFVALCETYVFDALIVKTAVTAAGAH